MSKTAVLPATPAWTLGSRPCKRFSGEVPPGPGEYALASHYDVCSTATVEPAFSIPGGRGLGSRQRTPGPADYKSDCKRIFPGKPAYTIAGRHSQGMHKSTTPGPGAYAVRSNSKMSGSHPNAPGYSMPSNSRGSELGHKVPGPGEYMTAMAEVGPRCSMKFRHEAGRLTGDAVASPGPGQYSLTSCDRPRSAAFSFGCSRPQSTTQTLREPRARTALASTSIHPHAVRGGSFSRTGRSAGGWVEVGPGPGAYQSVEKAAGVMLQSQPAYSFGSGRNVRSLDSKPGPGTYSPALTATTSRKAAFSIRARPQVSTHGSFSPGPGQYGTGPSKPHVGLAPNPPCYTFGLKALGDKEAERKPGPAAYNLELKPSPVAASLKFRHTSNAAQEAAEAMPGPADYRITGRNLCACNNVKGYTMGSRSP
ncbi:TPA: Outer dense fiber protein 3 [Trebouxia sp. C0005]